MRPKPGKVFLRVGQVGLVAYHNLGTLGKLAVALQLMVDLVEVLHGVAALAAGNIHHMEKQPRALHMPQEGMPQPRAFRSALNQAGNVR